MVFVVILDIGVSKKVRTSCGIGNKIGNWSFEVKCLAKTVKNEQYFFDFLEHGLEEGLELLFGFHVENMNFGFVEMDDNLRSDFFNFSDLFIAVFVECLESIHRHRLAIIGERIDQDLSAIFQRCIVFIELGPQGFG